MSQNLFHNRPLPSFDESDDPPSLRSYGGTSGQEVQRIENLEIALGAGEQIVAGRFGKSLEPIVPGLVDHQVNRADRPPGGLTEGAQKRAEALFAAALERPAPERATFLDGACHGDPSLRTRLDTLLAAHEQPAIKLADGNACAVNSDTDMGSPIRLA